MKIGELLIKKGVLTENELEIALKEQNVIGEMLGKTLVNLGFVTSKEIAEILAEQSSIEFVDLTECIIPEDALKMVSREVAEMAEFIPLNLKDGVLSIGVTNANNIQAVDKATSLTGKPPRIFFVDSESFYDALEKSYYFLENPIPVRIANAIRELKDQEEPPASLIASLAELLLMDGIKSYATDIHIRPMAGSVHVFNRVDGVMHHSHTLPKNVQNGILSRIKILAQLNIAESRLPQDGSFSFEFLSHKYEMRVSFVPTIYGENVVVRVLKATASVLRLSTLGFNEPATQRLRQFFAKPFGIILITGPTGSGKTTTLYSALREIDLLGKNVITVEDPVEYRLSMVRQTQVNLKAGYDFALAGRNFMRQDPDVMLLGEIRDEETAAMAIRAAITGHLVLSTLHTNDAVTAVPRLFDLNVDRFMLSSALLAVVAQRLIRKVCINCKTEYTFADGELSKLGLNELEGTVKTEQRGTGCAACNNSGYLGRIAIGEILLIDDEIKELIYQGASVNVMREVAIKNGMICFKDDAIKKAMDGVTTFEEVVRITI